MLCRINICHDLIVFFVLYINKTRPKFSIDCKIRICTQEKNISYSKIIQLPEVWVKLCHILYVRGGHLCGHLGFWKSQAGGRRPPTWNFIYGVVSCRKCNKMIVTKHCKVHCSGCLTISTELLPTIGGHLVILSRTCCIGFMPGHIAGQSTISTSCWSRNVTCYMWRVIVLHKH